MALVDIAHYEEDIKQQLRDWGMITIATPGGATSPPWKRRWNLHQKIAGFDSDRVQSRLKELWQQIYDEKAGGAPAVAPSVAASAAGGAPTQTQAAPTSESVPATAAPANATPAALPSVAPPATPAVSQKVDVRIAMLFTSEQALDSFKNDPLVLKFAGYVHDFVTKLLKPDNGDGVKPKPIIMGGSNETEYAVFVPTSSTDLLGSFEYDVLEGQLRIVVRPKAGGTFPQEWDCGEVTMDDLEQWTTDTAATTGSEFETLAAWLERIFRQNRRPLERASAIAKYMRDQGIYTPQELADIPEKLWNRMCDGANIHFGDAHFIEKQRTTLNRTKPKELTFQAKSDEEKARELHDIKAACHRIKRYFFCKFEGVGNCSIPKLDPAVAKEGKSLTLQVLRNTAVVDYVFDAFILPYTQLGNKAPPRGLLFYGPPGTGKTTIAMSLCKNCGFLMVTDRLLNPGDLNMPHVGESERLITSVCDRSKMGTHVPWIFPIDEIDSAVPKRSDSDGGNQHSTDKISVFLNKFSDDCDVPNLILLGATNRREAIDEAVGRRLHVQVYVGYPDRESREKIITSKLYAPVNKNLDGVCKTKPKEYFTAEIIQEFSRCTLNFSGAAICQVTNLLRMEWEKECCGACATPGLQLKQEELIRSLTDVSESMKIKIGSMTVPELLHRPSIVSKFYHKKLFGASKERLTGLGAINLGIKQADFIITLQTVDDDDRTTYSDLDMMPFCVRCNKVGALLCYDKEHMYNRDYHLVDSSEIQTLLRSHSRYNAVAKLIHQQPELQRKFPGSAETKKSKLTLGVEDIVRELAEFAERRLLNRIFFVNITTFMNVGASDTKKFVEELNGIAKQAQARGSRTMLILDLDSLAGVQMSTSQGMGGSDSFNMTHGELFDRCVEIFLSCRRTRRPGSNDTFGDPNDPNSDNECWCFCIMKDPYVARAFRNKSGFAAASIERQEEEEKNREQKCSRCQQTFTEAKNEAPGECSYHWGALLKATNKSTGGLRYHEYTEAEHLAGIPQRDQATIDLDISRSEGDRAKSRIFYSCCGGDLKSKCADNKVPHTSKRTKRVSLLPSEYFEARLDPLRPETHPRTFFEAYNERREEIKKRTKVDIGNATDAEAANALATLSKLDADYGKPHVPSDIRDDGSSAVTPARFSANQCRKCYFMNKEGSNSCENCLSDMRLH